MMPQKDYDDYTRYVNDNNHEKSKQLQLQSLRAGSQTMMTTPNSKTRSHSIDHHANKAVVKAKILESRVSSQGRFFELSQPF